ncbi:MAG: hypothetical protein AABY22_01600 [Nanoarchaeota archaeon]
MNQNELEQVIKYQKQTLEYLDKWLGEEIEKDKIKCQFCDEEAIKDALDGDGNGIKICSECDAKSKEKENK